MQDLPLPASNKQQQQQQQRDNCKKMPMDLMWELTDKLRAMDESSRNGASSRLNTSMLILLLASAMELGSQRCSQGFGFSLLDQDALCMHTYQVPSWQACETSV